eukprot:TRINITY_DN60479_c0_g1_i1.p1 TRINITY_DN60479_c0_g1~~TRINITY_DN60479_c0_g1_i1.p1  ORF type:complete len:764 (-),score=98.14 TRINITY_DN60479_c0_g1_i1:81-2372(-)
MGAALSQLGGGSTASCYGVLVDRSESAGVLTAAVNQEGTTDAEMQVKVESKSRPWLCCDRFHTQFEVTIYQGAKEKIMHECGYTEKEVKELDRFRQVELGLVFSPPFAVRDLNAVIVPIVSNVTEWKFDDSDAWLRAKTEMTLVGKWNLENAATPFKQVREGDAITSLNGKTSYGWASLKSELRGAETLRMTVRRGWKESLADITNTRTCTAQAKSKNAPLACCSCLERRFEVTICRAELERTQWGRFDLGVVFDEEVQEDDDPSIFQGFEVMCVRYGSQVERWNFTAAEPEQQVRAGDVLVSINGKTGRNEILAELRDAETLQMLIRRGVKGNLADITNRLKGTVGIFKKRLQVLADVGTDLLVVIDNATAWDGTYLYFLSWDPARDPCWAVIGTSLIALPFIVEFISMAGTAANGLQRQFRLTREAAYCIWLVVGLPVVVACKVYLLLFHPCGDAGKTGLTFLGAFDTLDFVTEAAFEAPLQALFSAYMALRKYQLHRRGACKFPTMILLALASSLWAMYEAYKEVVRFQSRQNRDSLGRALGPDEPAYISVVGAVRILYKAGCLEEFVERGRELSEIEIEEIVAALQNPSSIALLSLMDCGLDDAAFSKLMTALEENDSLVTLNLEFNKNISNMDAFANVLNKNSTLRQVRLPNASITNVDALGDALAKNNTLSELDLRFNPITNIDKLAEGLAKRSAGLHLDLQCCRVSSVDTLWDALAKNTTPMSIWLCSNPIADGDAKRALQNGEHVHTVLLRLRGC